ncbi:MAG: prephenate dehydrogenase [Eubacterium sp.]|nr:prephenate dehydrogenase [Eubacterium sp.]
MIVGFIGLGLIGGSLARSIRRAYPEYTIYAYSPVPDELKKAREEGVLSHALDANDPAFSECDLIFLCAPVKANISYLPFLKKTMKPTCILSDVGSVKKIMIEAAEKEGLGACFIGGHPMAGSEKTGYENSRDYLLENAYYLLTPTKENRPEDVAFLKELITSIHAIPLVMTPKTHDYVVAGVSHLPHIVASSLVNVVHKLDASNESEYMKQVAAGGFRDITRIASSSPEMWEHICLTNKDDILKVLDAYISYLNDARKLVASSDGQKINRMFASSRDYRDSLNDSVQGSVPREYTLYADIYDEAGGIATITTLLAMNQLNIKNIGVIHNREFEEGVLRIEFYDSRSRDKAEEVLKKRNYVIRKKK